ncbi:MAG: PhzF family phenazine biosynthesis protein [Thermoleophilia bacterium]|nr:PhzF family phenazine biosynthesis protein [Thermoleophilia bacterium]MDH5332310.1 PhzF family phenazine biosynthesis protein [Thermoleophilia bacterium]
MSALRFVVADVFTDVPLTGNQLAVFTDGRGVETDVMQALALETGFSETVFVLPAEADGDARIRIFTPRTELPFAGHPTLGTAFVLGGPLQRDALTLETGRGPVEVVLERDESGRIVFGRMRQPVPAVEPFDDTEALLAALGVAGSELPVECYDNGVEHVFVCLPSEDAVAALRPDMGALTRFGLTGVNCFAGAGAAWKTRMFSPLDGVGEDAATGSAAGPLACHLARHGRIEWGQEIVVTQGAEIGRPSTLFARAEGEGGSIAAVEVGGSAVIVARGEFRLP